MATKQELLALAERVEALTGPDRNIDTEILWHVDRGVFSRGYWNAASGLPRPLEAMPHPNAGLGWIGAQCSAPIYTASLDAAMTLVPEGWSVGIGNLPGRNWLVRAHLRDHRPESLTQDGHSHIWREGHHSTFALALTAAALRALAEQQP
jgi:hypothetical protein